MRLQKINILFYSISFFSAIAFSSCSKLNYMSVKVMEPAAIVLPGHIKAVAIVDRAEPPRQLEKIVTGKIIGEDVNRNQVESQQALSGLVNTLSQSGRLETKRTNLRLTGAQLGGTLPVPLSSDSITKICKEYEVDGIISLESFSYNTAVNNVEKAVKIAENAVKHGVMSAIGKTVGAATTVNNEIPHVITVKLAFRFYDGVNTSAFDQLAFSHTYNMHIDTYLNNMHRANETSYFAGKLYAKRIVPSYIWVNRTYYKRPRNRLMKVATRMAIIGDWKGASELWHKAEQGFSGKKAGRAAYNLALCYEVFGDLDQAIIWCKKSGSTYRNKLAKEYLKVLEQRVSEMKIVMEQIK